MKAESPFHTFNASNECVANVHGLKWVELPGTNGETEFPLGGSVQAVFHVQGRASKWPAFFPGDDPRIKFFSLPLAERIRESRLSGIELHPVELRLGELRGLKNKVSESPGYMWARVTGILFVDLILDGAPWPLDPTGMYRLQKPPVGRYPRKLIRKEQPQAADFCRIVPGGTGVIAISDRGARMFDEWKVKEALIHSRGEGILS
jgi:hypothetical protein